jgi:cell filamentation protein
MEDSTYQTPSPEDNLLGLTDRDLINDYEAQGIAKAELFLFSLDVSLA